MRVRKRGDSKTKRRNLRQMVKFGIHRLWVEMKETHKQNMRLRILCKKKKKRFKIKGVLNTTVSFYTEGKKAYE